MQRRRPGGLNPTLLEGSPRDAAAEYAACMGLEEDADAQAAMHADGLAWKERGFRTLCMLAVPRVACWIRPLLGVRKGSPWRAGARTHCAGMARGVALLLLQQTRGPLSAPAASARGSMSVSLLWGSAIDLRLDARHGLWPGQLRVGVLDFSTLCFDMLGRILAPQGGYPT